MEELLNDGCCLEDILNCEQEDLGYYPTFDEREIFKNIRRIKEYYE